MHAQFHVKHVKTVNQCVQVVMMDFTMIYLLILVWNVIHIVKLVMDHNIIIVLHVIKMLECLMLPQNNVFVKIIWLKIKILDNVLHKILHKIIHKIQQIIINQIQQQTQQTTTKQTVQQQTVQQNAI